MPSMQTQRLYWRAAFFALFVLAPPLDLLRLDLELGHFILLGQHWTLGLEGLRSGEMGVAEASFTLFWRVFLPLLLVAGGGLWVAWRFGRLYCGWLCPHFSVVEAINALMRRASGKPSLWERQPLPERLPDGRTLRPRPLYWLWVALAVLGFAFLWALTLLTYLLPPKEVYANLLGGTLSRNQALFLGVATLALALEFTLARHLFCRFGCAVGLFQSLAWMGNRRALVVGFDKPRASACHGCQDACDAACPMRLHPRTIKRKMFTCTQCTRCISACEQVQAGNPAGPLLRWVQGEAAAGIDNQGLRAPPSQLPPEPAGPRDIPPNHPPSHSRR
jgi:ferredoxin-type protein NapH